MPLVIADRVRETTTTSGTGTISLAGPYSGFQAFSVIGNGNTTYYAIIDAQNGAWEVGIGAYTSSGNTLSRATVLASSNAGSLVNFGTGTKDVILTQPARRSVLVQEGGSGLITGVAAFTANGVPYADSTSTLATSANMVFNGTRLTVADLADSGLTSGRVTYAAVGGALVDSANLTFNGTTLVAADLTDSSLTAGRVTYAGTGGNLVDSANLTFNGTTLTAAGLAGPFNGTVGATTASTGAFTTLTTSSTVTHNGGTANGVAYLNGSKVLTTGSALTFDGSVFAVGRSTPTTSIVSRWDNTNDSNRGAAMYLSGASGSGLALLASTSSGYPLAFGVDGSEQMRLTSTGLGIGTSSPGNALVLNRSGATNTYAQFYNGANTAGYVLGLGTDGNVYSYAAGAFAQIFGTNNTERARITSTGRVGIGTTSPNEALDVVGSINITENLQLTANRYLYSSSGGSLGAVRSGLLLDGSAQALIFLTGQFERARITSSGDLLVGASNYQANTPRLYVTKSSQGNSGNNIVWVNDSAATATAAMHVWSFSQTTVPSSANFVDAYYNGVSTLAFRIAGNGNVTNANNSYGAISDAKLKENIVDATPKLEKLQQVRVVNYNLIGETQKQLGVVAQELEQIFPGMIDESPDRDAEGNDLGTTTKSVKYSVFVPVLIKAIQEQQALIQTLTARVTALESN